ncbi:MAG: FlgD immunoglobulin-like domain containing protein [Elusimicrobiota bacterium]
MLQKSITKMKDFVKGLTILITLLFCYFITCLYSENMINWQTVNLGGSRHLSADYIMAQDAVSSSPVGQVGSTNYTIQTGFINPFVGSVSSAVKSNTDNTYIANDGTVISIPAGAVNSDTYITISTYSAVIPKMVYDENIKITVTTDKVGKFKVVYFAEPTEQISAVSSYPNPFYCGSGKNAKIRYTLKEDANVKITVIDLAGNVVISWDIKASEEGGKAGQANEVAWDGRNSLGDYVTAGVYLCKIESKNKKVIWKIGVK